MPPEETKDLSKPTGAGLGGGGEDSAGTGAPDNVDGRDADEVGKLPEWAQRLIRETRKEAAAHRKLVSELQAKEQERGAAEKKAEEERLAKQGEYQTLAEQRGQALEAMKARAERAAALEARIKADNEARIKSVPEAMRSLIPKYSDPVELAEWLGENIGKLTSAKPAPNLDGGKRGENRVTPPTGKRRLRF
jgi:hypothetical protein